MNRSASVTSGCANSISVNSWSGLLGVGSSWRVSFYEAIALSPEEREAFLAERCAGDETMRKEAESLLASLDQPLDWLEKPIRNAASEVVTGGNAPARKAGARFGRYEIIRPIGAGGMGRVCLARDRQLRRQVALKFLLSWADIEAQSDWASAISRARGFISILLI